MKHSWLLRISAVLLIISASCFGSESELKGFTFSPDGAYLFTVYFDGASSFIYKVALDSGKATRFTDAKEGFEGVPSFSADGKRIAYSYSPNKTGSDAHLVIANADGSDARVLGNSGSNDLGALLFPDGQSIVFKRYGYYGSYSPIAQAYPHEWNFYAADVDGSNVRHLTNDSFYMVSPASLSPDGETLLFVDSFERIMLYPVKTSSKPKVVLKPRWNGKKAGAYSRAVFAPDGKSIVFTAAFTSNFWGRYNYNIYRLDLETQGVEPLTTEKGHDGDFAVSRDDRSLVFAHTEYKHETTSILLLNLATRKLTPLPITGLP